jgi:hypothetical protein
MKQVLNEELFRIQEIMGIKKTDIIEDFQFEQNDLISEQVGDLVQAIADVGKSFDDNAMSVIDDVVSRETRNLSYRNTIPKTYNTLEELSAAIVKKEIPEAVVETVSKTIMKQIIGTPEGAELIAKTWFKDNVGTNVKNVITKIESGANLPPKLVFKTADDFDLLVKEIKTGDDVLDNELKAALDDVYGKPLKNARTEAEDAIAKAKAIDDQYDNIRSSVRNKIKGDPLLSKKKFADWFGYFEDETKRKIKSEGEYKARQYLFEQLQKPSIWGRIKSAFQGEKWYKVLEYVRKKGVTMGVSVGSLIIIGVVVYYAVEGLSKIPETVDELREKPYTKIKKVYPSTENASEAILNAYLNVAKPDDLEKLFLKADGYGVSYKTYENEALGPIEELTVETPTNTYNYKLFKDDNNKITPTITPKGGGDQKETNNQTKETIKTWLTADANGEHNTGKWDINTLGDILYDATVSPNKAIAIVGNKQWGMTYSNNTWNWD